MSNVPPPAVGIEDIDRLIRQAMERGWQFPAGVPRWRLLAWAAEALEARKRDPVEFDRREFARLTEEIFPGSTKP